MMLRKLFGTPGVSLMTLILTPFVSPTAAHAEVKVAALGFGLFSPTVLGSNYETYIRGTGLEIEGFIPHEDWLGSNYQFRVALKTAPYSLRNVDQITIRQWDTFIGVATRPEAGTQFIRPFAAFSFGTAYTRMSYDSAINSPTQNASIALATEFQSGIYVPVVDHLGASFSVPVTVVFSSNKFVTLSTVFSLRWTL